MKNFINKYLYLILPFITALILYLLKDIIKINDIATLVSIAGALIGIMITNLTLYVTFITSNTNVKNLILSAHHKIFINNINIGITWFILCIMFWVFGVKNILVLLLFVMGLTNVNVSLYYISVIAKNIKKY